MANILNVKIGNQWVSIPAIVGPKGPKGDKGDTGAPVRIAVNNTTYSQSGGTITLPSYYTQGQVNNYLNGKSSVFKGSGAPSTSTYPPASYVGCIYVDTSSHIVYISNGSFWEGMNTYQ